MDEKIRKHMETLFAAAPKTRKAMELREEMTQNTIEKYHDLLSEGHNPEDAYQNVISSIGDVTELFEDCEEKNLLTLSETDRKKRAMLTSVSVGMYIFAGIAFFLCAFMEESGYGSGMDMYLLGLIMAAAICIAPTCMLVYAANMYPGYQKREENLVENYKESKYISNKDKAVRNSIRVIIWTLVFILYFIVSFETMAWYITWVLFLIGGCAQAVAELIFSLRRND